MSMDNQLVAQTNQELGMSNSHTESKGVHSADVTENKSHKLDKTGQEWSDTDREYLRTHWMSAGRTAKQSWVTCKLHLHRSEDDCRAEYRRLTTGKKAAQKIEAKKLIVKREETPIYNADQEILALFKKLSPFMRCLIAELHELGEMEELSLNKKKGLLMVQFTRNEEPKDVFSVIETDAGNIPMK